MRLAPFLAPVLVALVTAAHAEVVVRFSDPDKFTDAGDWGIEARRTTDEIAAYLRRLGKQHLQSGQDLTIEILDIDLAGRKRMGGGSANEVRVLRGAADWPSMKLRYTLSEGSRTVRQAEETVSDLMYLQVPPPRQANESLAHEKRMLEEWFRARFATQGSRSPS